MQLKIRKDKEDEGLSLSLAKKNIAINSENEVPVMIVTNEYGNSARYEISDSYQFDNLWSQLWQFVKDSQH